MAGIVKSGREKTDLFAARIALGLLLAQSGHSATEFQCPLLGVKRTFLQLTSMSVIDP